MKSLYIEIQDKFSLDIAGFKSAVGNLYDGYIPPKSSYPCAVIFCISDLNADTFTEEIHNTVFQVDVYTSGTSSASCRDALSAAIKFFTGQTFSPAGLDDVHFIRDRVQHPRRESKLWRGSVDLRAVVMTEE